MIFGCLQSTMDACTGSNSKTLTYVKAVFEMERMVGPERGQQGKLRKTHIKE